VHLTPFAPSSPAAVKQHLFDAQDGPTSHAAVRCRCPYRRTTRQGDVPRARVDERQLVGQRSTYVAVKGYGELASFEFGASRLHIRFKVLY
jgi:hypothetical protein